MKETIAYLALVLCVQAPASDSSAITLELTQIVSAEGVTGTALWCPAEFFRDALQSKEKYSPEEVEKILDAFRDVNLFAVICGEIAQGKPSYAAPASIAQRLTLRVASGNEISPLSDDAISPELRSFAAAMRPVLAGSLGPTGKNMALVFFPGRDKEGKRGLDPFSPGSFRLKVRDFPAAGRHLEFRWRLPLDSLLPPKECPKCHERCKGSWSFCPWDGSKL